MLFHHLPLRQGPAWVGSEVVRPIDKKRAGIDITNADRFYFLAINQTQKHEKPQDSFLNVFISIVFRAIEIVMDSSSVQLVFL